MTLVEGLPEEVAIVRRIFHEYVDLEYSKYRIAAGLNNDGISSPSRRRWRAGSVQAHLRTEKYAGTIVYNQTSQKQFEQARRILERHKRKYGPDLPAVDLRRVQGRLLLQSI